MPFADSHKRRQNIFDILVSSLQLSAQYIYNWIIKYLYQNKTIWPYFESRNDNTIKL